MKRRDFLKRAGLTAFAFSLAPKLPEPKPEVWKGTIGTVEAVELKPRTLTTYAKGFKVSTATERMSAAEAKVLHDLAEKRISESMERMAKVYREHLDKMVLDTLYPKMELYEFKKPGGWMS